MPKVLPSAAVAAIDRMFPFLRDANANPNLGRPQAHELAALLALVSQVPDELITLAGERWARFIEARARIEAFLEELTIQGRNAQNFQGSHVRTVQSLLATCPDQVIPAALHTLGFVADQQLRESLRIDIASVESSVRDGDWKAATVIAGSVVEALLLDALMQEPAHDVAAAIIALVANGTFRQQHAPNANTLERWDLHQFTEVAAQRGIIVAATAAQVRIAREFRNLIHPGRAMRLAQQCDRGTALAATAALEFVIRDLTP